MGALGELIIDVLLLLAAWAVVFIVLRVFAIIHDMFSNNKLL